MRIVVVAPGHAFSTYDVFTGLCAGLRANGAHVSEFPLHDSLEMYDLLIGAARTLDIAPTYPDPMVVASAGIPGYVMAKRADWTIFVHGLNVPPSIPETLRRGGYPTALLCTESPYQMDQERNEAMFYDVVLTNERRAVDRFTHNQPGTVHYLPHAWHPAIHTPEGPRADPCDVFFCGTRYPERDALLNGVDWTGIAVLDRTLRYADTVTPEVLMRQTLPNHEVAAHYRSAKISLNQHRRAQDLATGGEIAPEDAESLNPRSYEIPACGGFQLSDVRAELPDLFGDSVPIYTDAASLERLIRYYLSHEDERQVLAARQFAAVQAHSWTSRAAALLAVLAQSRRPQRLAA